MSCSECSEQRIDEAGSSMPQPLITTGEQLLTVLREPEDHALLPYVWVALTASDVLIAEHPAHTLAGQLRHSCSTLNALAREARLWGDRGLRWPSVIKRLCIARAEDQLRPLIYRLVADDDGVQWLAYHHADEVHFSAR